MRRRLIVASVLSMIAVPQVAAARAFDPDDEVEVRVMKERKPHALALVEEGEALGAAGSLWEADTRFRQAEAELPDVALPWRRDCEALTALGRRGEALTACSRALEIRRANVNLRALIRALVDGPSAPTVNELFQALAITASVRDKGLATTPVAMTCDIAEGIGDGAMLRRCTEELEQLAPKDPQTRRAEELLQGESPRPLFWGGWLALAAAGIATAGHALRRGGSRRRGLAAALTLALVAGPVTAHAQPQAPTDRLSQWPVDDAHPESSIPTEKQRNADPLQFGYWLQDLVLKANRARANGDHAAAARFFQAMATAVPDRAVAFVKLCEDYEAMGDLQKAIGSCGDALLVDGATVHDYVRFVDLLLSKPGTLQPKEVLALNHVVQHMKSDPAAGAAADEVECKVAVRTSNVVELRECSAAMAAREPDGVMSITYEWALAILEGNLEGAESLVKRAKAAGIPIDGMAKATADSESHRRWMTALILAAIALVGGGVAVGGRAWKRRSSSLTPKTA
jgi:tetratricopeptide (TPR) repeat protein